MDLCDLAGEPEAFEPAHQEVRRIAVLGENDELLVGVLRVAEHLAELFELGFLASIEQFPRLVEQVLNLETLRLELGKTDCDGATQSLGLEVLVLLAVSLGRGVFVGGLRLEQVIEVIEAPLLSCELFFR